MNLKQAQGVMDKLVRYFDQVDEAKELITKLELDTRYDGFERYAEALWEAENIIDEVIRMMACDITVAQIRIDRRKDEYTKIN